MKRLISIILCAVLLCGTLCMNTGAIASDALADQEGVIGSYTDAAQSLAQPDGGYSSTTEIYPSPTTTSVRNPTSYTFLMINLKGYSGQYDGNAERGDAPLDDNFYYSLRTTFENARNNEVMLGIRVRFDDSGYENKEPDWDNMIQMLVDIGESGILEEYADIIVWCEIGTLGAFGELWGTRYGNYGYFDELIDLYLQILPEDVPLLIRTANKITHWVNSRLGTSYNSTNIQNMADEVCTTYKDKVNGPITYYSGDGKDFSSGRPMWQDLARLGLYNDGYMGTGNDYGTFENRANETAFLNDQKDVVYGGEFSGDRYLQLYTDVWYPINSIPEMYYTDLAYLHGAPWTERAGMTYSFSTLSDATSFVNTLNSTYNKIGRTELYGTSVTTKDADTGKYVVTYTAPGFDTLAFTSAIESAAEAKIGATLDLSEYYTLDARTFIMHHLGYRFVVRDSDMTGTLTPGGELSIELDVENTGFHKINKNKEVELLLVNGTTKYEIDLDVDVTEWDAGVNTLNTTVAIPESITGGKWQVYLRITPENRDAADDAKYGVKFANADIFDATLGANLIGQITVDGPEADESAYVETRLAGRYYRDATAYPADTAYLNFLDSPYTFTTEGAAGLTILFKVDGISEGSEINLTRWETNGSGGQLHSFNYFFKNNATYGFGQTFTENGYYIMYSPFLSLGSHYSVFSQVGSPTYSYFYVNSTGTAREDKNTPTSLNGNAATIMPLGVVEGAPTSYSVTVHAEGKSDTYTGTYSFKNTDNPRAGSNCQFIMGTRLLDLTDGYDIEGYVGDDGIAYKFAGWTTMEGYQEGIVDENEIAMGTLDLYPYFEPDFTKTAQNAITYDYADGKDENGLVYTLDHTAKTATVGTGTGWSNNAGFAARSGNCVVPAYLNVDGVYYQVTGIGSDAFSGNVELRNLYLPSGIASIADSAFDGISDGITVYTPAQTAGGNITYTEAVADYCKANSIDLSYIESDVYAAIYKLEDGTVINVSSGIDADYEAPEREADGDWCAYKCTGWTPAVSTLSADTAFTAVYEKLGHLWGEYVSNGDATCTADGTKTAECENCDQTDTQPDEGSKLAHELGEYVSNGDATCTADGTKTAKCENCDHTDTQPDEGSKLAHELGEYVSNGDATCGEDGTKTAKCENCVYTDTLPDEGSATGEHNYTWEVTTPPAVGVAGEEKGTCTVCGDVITRELTALAPETGDANGDGEINIIDLTLTAQYIAQGGVDGKFDLGSCDIDAMDVNGDGTIGQLDLNALARIAAKQ